MVAIVNGLLSSSTRDGRSEWVWCSTPQKRQSPVVPTAAAPSSSTGTDLLTHGGTFEVRQTADSGFGCFATRDIKRGERILAETPLVECTIPKDGNANLTAIIETLEPEARKAFYALCQNEMYGTGAKSAVGIWKSNAYPQGSPMDAARDLLHGIEPPDRAGACYALACRFNHSCSPNAHCAWNRRLRKQTIHILTDVKAGTELCVNYLPELAMPTEDRRRRLHTDFGFVCACAACAKPDDAREASDRRRERIGQLGPMVRGARRYGVCAHARLPRGHARRHARLRASWHAVPCTAYPT